MAMEHLKAALAAINKFEAAQYRALCRLLPAEQLRELVRAVNDEADNRADLFSEHDEGT